MKKTIQHEGKTLQFFIEKEGDGLPLVLLHGFCEDSSIWESVLQKLNDSRQVVAVDLPGFGGSEVAKKSGIGEHAAAVRAVLDFLKIEKCHLVGHSMGGYTALEFLKNYPERLEKLTLLHSHPYPDSDVAKENRLRGIEMLRSGKQNQYVAQLFPNLFPKDFAEANPQILEKLIARARQFSAEGIVAALENMMHRADHRATLEQATCPVQFIIGKLDSLISEENAQAMCALPPIAAVHFLKNVGHMGLLEAPNEIGRRLTEFGLTGSP